MGLCCYGRCYLRLHRWFDQSVALLLFGGSVVADVRRFLFCVFLFRLFDGWWCL